MTTFSAEFKVLMRSLIKWAVVLLFLAAIIFSVGLQSREVFGHNVLLPQVTVHSFAATIFERLSHDLVPKEAQLVATSPLDAFIIEMELSLLCALFLISPFLLAGVLRYLSPALYASERRALALVMVPIFFLFVGGAVFSYFFIVPTTFSFLYMYVPAIGVQPLFVAREFIATTLAMLIASGFMFQIPVAMVLLTRIGLIPASFWRAQWRWAVLTFLIVTAIITPDGSGITMAIFSVPLTVLYIGGLVISTRQERRRGTFRASAINNVNQ